MTKLDLNTPRPHLRTLARESLLLNMEKHAPQLEKKAEKINTGKNDMNNVIH